MWDPGIKKLRALKLFIPNLVFLIYFIHQILKLANIFEGHWSKGHFILTPASDASVLYTISGVTGRGQGAECPPKTSDREIFADVSGKKRQGKKKEVRKKGERGENGEQKKENFKREGGKLLMAVGKVI